MRPKSREETPKEGSDSGVGVGGATAYPYLIRSRSAPQLHVGNRPVSKGVTELYQDLWRSPLKSTTSALGPGRVKTFFVPQNCTQPGAMDLDATVLAYFCCIESGVNPGATSGPR
jgi:hypothetical protein